QRVGCSEEKYFHAASSPIHLAKSSIGGPGPRQVASPCQNSRRSGFARHTWPREARRRRAGARSRTLDRLNSTAFWTREGRTLRGVELDARKHAGLRLARDFETQI